MQWMFEGDNLTRKVVRGLSVTKKMTADIKHEYFKFPEM